MSDPDFAPRRHITQQCLAAVRIDPLNKPLVAIWMAHTFDPALEEYSFWLRSHRCPSNITNDECQDR